MFRQPAVHLSSFLLLSVCCVGSSAGTASTPHSFDVVSIHNQGSDDKGWHMYYTHDGFSASGVTLEMMLEEASGIYDNRRITGGQSWLRSTRFSVLAKITDGHTNVDQLSLPEKRALLLNLLISRFNLKLTYSSKAVPTLSLDVYKNNVKLRPVDPGVSKGFVEVSRPGILQVKRLTIGDFAKVLQAVLGQPIVDKTGLTGVYDLSVRWNPEPNTQQADAAGFSSAPESSSESEPNIYLALREQLGLDLRHNKLPQDVLVIDNADMPSPN